jgi:hypothetical protein
MSRRLQGGLPMPFSGGEKGLLAENSKELLRLCLKSVHELSRCYFYSIASDKSIPGSLSYLLNIEEGDLVAIFKICGFYNEKKGVFLLAAFRTWVAATFEPKTVEVTSFRKKPLIKIGRGSHPRRPTDQLKENLDPPRFRMQTVAGQGKLSKDSLMNLFHKPSSTTTKTSETSMPTTTTQTDTTMPSTPATSTAESTPLSVPSSPVKLCQRFNISSPDKPKLAMELVSEMDTPQKAPLMRELVKGSSITIETLNNSSKKFIHVPQCSNQPSAMSQNVKYKFIQEIVYTLGAGAEKVADGLNKGALWLCMGLAHLFRAEYVQSASRAGITCITRMSPEATGAMWTDAKMTKSKSRKISEHLLDWFKKPITAKEPDVDAFGTRPQVKRKYDSFQLTSEKGKKQSEEDIKKRRRVIELKYWVSNPLESVEDELVSRLHTTGNSKQPIKGFQFPLLDTPVPCPTMG